MKKNNYIQRIFIIVLCTFSTFSNSNAKINSSPEIIILTTALGKEGDEFPKELIELWIPMSVKQYSEDIAQSVKLSRIDLTEEKELVITYSHWLDDLLDWFLAPDSRVVLRRKYNYLKNFKVTGDFSTSQPSDVNQIKSRKEKYKREIPTVFEIVEKTINELPENQFSSVDEFLPKLKERIENDIQNNKPLKYLVLYKLSILKSEQDLSESGGIVPPETQETGCPPVANNNTKKPDTSTVSGSNINCPVTINTKTTSEEMTERLKQGIIIIVMPVHFSTNSTQIQDDDITLQKFADALKRANNPKFKIVGYTDSDGEETYNKGLSYERALSIKNFLVKEGVPENTLSIEAYGEENPIASNETEEGKAKNRRVEFIRVE